MNCSLPSVKGGQRDRAKDALIGLLRPQTYIPGARGPSPSPTQRSATLLPNLEPTDSIAAATARPGQRGSQASRGRVRPRGAMKVVSLFTGAGGLDLGLHKVAGARSGGGAAAAMAGRGALIVRGVARRRATRSSCSASATPARSRWAHASTRHRHVQAPLSGAGCLPAAEHGAEGFVRAAQHIDAHERPARRPGGSERCRDRRERWKCLPPAAGPEEAVPGRAPRP